MMANLPRIANYIDGRFVAPASGQYLDNIDPATGAAYSQLPDGDERDVENAVQAAERAFPAWSTTPAAERSRILLKIADLIEANLDKLARAESIDSGKPITLAKTLDIPRAASNFRFFATAILHTQSEAHMSDLPGPVPGAALNYTLRQPRGVAGLISPWNLPLYLFTWKVAPAIATGNTAVAKPSEITPMTAFMLAHLCQEAGLPPGVLNIVHGLGPKVGAAIIAHPRTSAISFTGGTKTGAEIARVAGPMFKKLSLELGGKNPNIIFADADMDQAIGTSVRSSFANQGQICLCSSRILVERPGFDSFVDRFVEQVTQLRLGDPLDPQTDQGAIASKQHYEKINAYLKLAGEEGGKVLCGGKRPPSPRLPDRCKDGYFIEPTVVTGLNCNCRTNQEEIFGPVVTIMPFDDEREVIEMANSVEYGLSASVWTRNLDRAHSIAARIQSGTVWVNCWLLRDLRVPFGGMKASGVGREGGEEAIRFFTEPKNVCIALASPS
jgi:aminomuconate-semialdehyde/2-hydroxymuconate-6-semialdehyde dehydrogenase